MLSKVKEKVDQLVEFNIAMLFFSLVLNHQLQNMIILFVSMITVLDFFFNKKKIRINFKLLLVPFLIFLMLFLGVFYSGDKNLGWLIVSRNLGWVFLPVLVALNKKYIHLKGLKTAFLFLEISVFIMIFFSFCFLVFNYSDHSTFNVYSDVSGALVGSLYIGPYLTESIGIHNIYFAFFIAILLVYKLIHQKKYNSYLFWMSTVLLFVYFLLLHSANLSLVLGLILMLLVFSQKKMHFLMKISLVLILIFSGISIGKDKIPDINIDLNYTKPYYISSLELRLLTWNVAIDNIKQHYLIGVGTGSLKTVMTSSFEEKSFEWGIKHRYDPHNQFLSFWLQNGIILLFLFISLLCFPIVNSIKKKDYFSFSILFIIFSFSLTESVFMTQTGLFGCLVLIFSIQFYLSSLKD